MAVGYVLVSVSPGNEFEVFKKINEVEFVADATLLFGDYDIIAKLESEGMNQIAKIVVNVIRQIPGVIDTKTLAGAEF